MYHDKKIIEPEFYFYRQSRQSFEWEIPPYTSFISDLFKRTSCNYALRTSDFLVPRVNTVTFGKRSASYLGPVLWSKLSSEVKQSETIKIFKLE